MNLTINADVTPVFTIPAEICAAATAPLLPAASDNGITGTWNPASVNNTVSSSYTFTPDAGQCAQPVTITITVHPVGTSTTNTAICPSQLPYTWNGNTYNAAGTYTVTLTGTGGCDSIATLNLTVQDVLTSTTNAAICTSQLPYTWNGNTYNAAGTYTVTLTGAGGCDSIATLILLFRMY